MSRLRDFHRRGVLVTGASSGIGRVLSLRVAARGARVALVARRTEALEALAGEIRAAGGEAVALPCDVADRDAVLDCARLATERLGPIDVLVNNAGYGRHRRFLDWDLEDMERMMRVNYSGALGFSKALLPAMVERGRGWIVMVSSLAGRVATPGESAYAASKHAMRALGRSLSLEVEAAGVHVLNVYPGVIDTPFFDAEALARMPAAAKRGMAPPEKLVEAILVALARGRRELTWPRWLAVGPLTGALAPALLRAGLRRTALRALDAGEEERP